MGNEVSSAYNMSAVDALSREISFDKTSMLELQKEMTKAAGVDPEHPFSISEGEFGDILKLLELEPTISKTLTRMFTVCDAGGDGVTNSREFASGLGPLVAGSTKEKVFMSLKLYDVLSSNEVDAKSLEEVLKTLSRTLDMFGDEVPSESDRARVVKDVFSEEDGAKSLESVAEAVSSHPVVLQFAREAARVMGERVRKETEGSNVEEAAEESQPQTQQQSSTDEISQSEIPASVNSLTNASEAALPPPQDEDLDKKVNQDAVEDSWPLVIENIRTGTVHELFFLPETSEKSTPTGQIEFMDPTQSILGSFPINNEGPTLCDLPSLPSRVVLRIDSIENPFTIAVPSDYNLTLPNLFSASHDNLAVSFHLQRSQPQKDEEQEQEQVQETTQKDE